MLRSGTITKQHGSVTQPSISFAMTKLWYIKLFPKPLGSTANTSLPSSKLFKASSCLSFKTKPPRRSVNLSENDTSEIDPPRAKAIFRIVDLSTACQCEANVLSTQINLYCLMTNQMAELLKQRAPWTRVAVMLVQSLYFSRPPPPRAIIPTPAPSVHLKIKMAAINGRTRSISTIPRKNRGLWTVYQLSYEATHWERGQFIEFISPVRGEMLWSNEIIHFELRL